MIVVEIEQAVERTERVVWIVSMVEMGLVSSPVLEACMESSLLVLPVWLVVLWMLWCLLLVVELVDSLVVVEQAF